MFEKHRVNNEYAALLDIGSGSITVSIVYSNHQHDRTEVIWTYHERLLLKHTNEKRGKKPLLSSLVQSMLKLGSEGIQALKTFDAGATVNTLQVGISAPWSYTVTKSIKLQKEDPFAITKALIAEVNDKAEAKIEQEISDNEIASSLDLSIVSRCITELRANDYQIDTLNRSETNSLELTLSSIIIQRYLHNAIQEAQHKVLPNSKIQITSTVLQLYFSSLNIPSRHREYCIMNITLEATEIALIREGVFTYSTHEPYGIIHIAQEIAELVDVPLVEIYSLMQKNENLSTSISKSRKNDAADSIENILHSYRQRIAGLYKQTGDEFTIPKTIYIHCTGCAYEFIVPQIEQAAEQASGFSHIVHTFPDILNFTIQNSVANTCIEEVSGTFFHRYGHDTRFTYL